MRREKEIGERRTGSAGSYERTPLPENTGKYSARGIYCIVFFAKILYELLIIISKKIKNAYKILSKNVSTSFRNA